MGNLGIFIALIIGIIFIWIATIVLIVGFIFGWQATSSIEGHGKEYALNVLVASFGSIVGYIIYRNIPLLAHNLWVALSAFLIVSLFIYWIVTYSSSNKRKRAL